MSEKARSKTRSPVKVAVFFGLLWGMMMFLFMEILTPHADDESIAAAKLPFRLILWLFMGFVVGYLTHVVTPGLEKRFTKKT